MINEINYNGTLMNIKNIQGDFIGQYIVRIGEETLRIGAVSQEGLLKDLLEEGFNLNDKCRISGPIRGMSKKEIEEQKRAFAYGNAKLDCPYITRKDIDMAAEKLKNSEGISIK